MAGEIAERRHRKLALKPGRLIRSDQCRRAIISVFVLFHFCALTLWIIPPYAEMIAKAPHADSPAGHIEQQLSAALAALERGFPSILVRNYINIIGAHQYWDFFAPKTSQVHRYLSVCTKILEASEHGQIECIDPLYQSFEGGIDNAAQPHHGNQSRSFRLVENLIRLKRPDLLNAFTLYWSHKITPEASHSTFLLIHEFNLQPGKPESATGRRDELIWLVSD